MGCNDIMGYTQLYIPYIPYLCFLFNQQSWWCNMIYNGFKQQIGGQRMIDMDNQWLYGNHMGIEPMNMVFKQRMYGYVLVYIYRLLWRVTASVHL